MSCHIVTPTTKTHLCQNLHKCQISEGPICLRIIEIRTWPNEDPDICPCTTYIHFSEVIDLRSLELFSEHKKFVRYLEWKGSSHILTLKIRNVGDGVGECRWGMGRDSGKCLHQLDVLWVCGQPHIPVVGSNCSCKCSKYPPEVCLHAEMQRV